MIVVFSHGRESGPWGAKITAMAAAVRGLGLGVESVDYRGIDDAQMRVDKLLAVGGALGAPLVLAGSSLGGYVAASAAGRLAARGLFLLAPALHMAVVGETPRNIPCPAVVVHGWRDDIVPVDNSIRFAREQRAELHILDSDHRLEDRIPAITGLLTEFLRRLQGP